MGYSLRCESGERIGFNMFGWAIARKLAEQFGWHPLGTKPPARWDSSRAWDGSYTGNNGQLVSAQDALALGMALEAALAANDFEARIRTLYGRAVEQIRTGDVQVSDPTVDGSAWRTEFEEFAQFCRKGGFQIL